MSTSVTEAPPDRRLICAHRGASDAFPDNSLAAFEAAIAAGADLIETDVRAGPGGELVLSHDPLDPTAEPPVTLAALLELARDRIGLDLELKERDLDGPVAEALTDWTGPLLISAFAPETIADVRRRRPALRTGLIVAAPVTVHPVRAALACGATAVLWEDELATPTALRACAEAGLGAWVWTVNAPFRLAERLAEPSLEGVITDVPALAASLRPPDPAVPTRS